MRPPLRPSSWLLLAFAVGAASVLLHAADLLHGLPGPFAYSDVLDFYKVSKFGGIPYVDTRIEYPVITGVFIHFMGALGGSRAGYYFASGVFLTLALVLATHLLQRMTPDESRGRLLSFWLLAPSMPVFLVYNWDMIALLFVVSAFYAMQRKRDGLAAYFLAFACASKFYPLLYLAPLILRQPGLKERARVAGVFLATTLALNGFFMWANWQGWAWFYLFNRQRPPNPDSIWGVIQVYLIPSLDTVTVNTVSLILFAGCFASVLWIFRRAETLKLCFAATLLFLGFNKVFSPQYTLWLLPFFVLLPPPKKTAFYAMELSNLGVLWCILVWFGGGDPGFFGASVIFVLLRHGGLAWILVDVLRGLSSDRLEPAAADV